MNLLIVSLCLWMILLGPFLTEDASCWGLSLVLSPWVSIKPKPLQVVEMESNPLRGPSSSAPLAKALAAAYCSASRFFSGYWSLGFLALGLVQQEAF